jgi:folate-binding protein YgfZ
MYACLNWFARSVTARPRQARVEAISVARLLYSKTLQRSGRRDFSIHNATLVNAAPLCPQPSGIAKLSHRALISVAGEDAAQLLQGLVTNSMQSLSERTGIYAAFLNAQGRILTDCFIYRIATTRPDDGYLIEVDRSVTSNLLQYLKTHKLRSKTTFSELPAGEFEVWAAWDADIKARATEGTWPQQVLHMPDPRLANFAHRMLVPARTSTEGQPLQHMAPEAVSELHLQSSDEYRMRRYISGIAEGLPDIQPNKSLPHEYNMDYLNGIDFQKGCYVGQELTIRTQHTGVVRKRILPVQVYAASHSDVPLNLQVISSKTASAELGFDAENIPRDTKIRPVGRPRTAAGKWAAGLGNVGLASCRLEMMTDIRISADADQTAAADVGKHSEFGLAEWEDGGEGRGELKIKAFVPSWLRSRLQQV